MTRKSFARLIRRQHVVRAALFQGGHAASRMEGMIRVMQKRRIWIHSELRLLRLVGKRCEGCNQKRLTSFNYNSSNFGVLFCKHGCKAVSKYIQRVSVKKAKERFVPTGWQSIGCLGCTTLPAATSGNARSMMLQANAAALSYP